jgi:hypothetical protein
MSSGSWEGTYPDHRMANLSDMADIGARPKLEAAIRAGCGCRGLGSGNELAALDDPRRPFQQRDIRERVAVDRHQVRDPSRRQ